MNFLQKMVRGMCSDGGVAGRKTNHSLRATAAMQMYEAGVPEKMIQERTGHRSVTALREYQRTLMTQTMAVAKVLSASEKHSYSTTLGHNYDASAKCSTSTTTAQKHWLYLQQLTSTYRVHPQ